MVGGTCFLRGWCWPSLADEQAQHLAAEKAPGSVSDQDRYETAMIFFEKYSHQNAEGGSPGHELLVSSISTLPVFEDK